MMTVVLAAGLWAATAPSAKADVGFVQGGLAEGRDLPHLVSLGSVYPQPLISLVQLATP